MTDRIIERVNEFVMPQDYLFYLGDWSLDTSEQQFEEDLAKFNCKNILMIWGNHNSPIRYIYDREVYNWNESGSQPGADEFGSVEVYPLRYKNIVFCGDYMEIIVNGTHIVMCHYPMDVFNKMRHNAYMLCGHSHGTYPKTRIDCKENKRLDLSWDCHNKPLSFEEIKNIMDKKELMSFDHHGKKH